MGRSTRWTQPTLGLAAVDGQSRVAPQTAQPFAGGRNPVGIGERLWPDCGDRCFLLDGPHSDYACCATGNPVGIGPREGNFFRIRRLRGLGGVA